MNKKQKVSELDKPSNTLVINNRYSVVEPKKKVPEVNSFQVGPIIADPQRKI